MKTTAALATLSALIQHSLANLDVVTLYAKPNAYIQEASATLVVGDVPGSITGDVALWSAIMMENQASFLQGVTENAPQGLGYCTDLGKQWCNFAYALVNQSKYPMVENLYLPLRSLTDLIVDKLNSQTRMWDQNLYINDKLTSSVTTSQGQHGEIFYISVECAAGTCATAPAHSWEDVSITLSQADSTFGRSGGWQYGATGGKMSTPDGGKTWRFTTLKVPATNP
ncbi:hypothetical protein LCI18_011011 [Fusarium solani-melongenae]|uniref:Uncharacterized protein n=1 Tax=Fusarium solani subsp. cucurbitae TaxID=2747967 RepID=A0ACD3ZFU2_FUSSC|nr:hypothetical protein LCI18_011011 [Fusarium solani-melongenae]